MRPIVLFVICTLIFLALMVSADGQAPNLLVTVDGPLMADEYFITFRGPFSDENTLPHIRAKVYKDGSYEIMDQSDTCQFWTYKPVRDGEAWFEICEDESPRIVYKDQYYTSINLPDPYDFHDFYIDATDNIYGFTYNRESGRPFGFTIQKQSPDHQLLWQWNSDDHMSPDEALTPRQRTRDYAHINSIDVLDPLVLVSLRGTNSVLAINEQSGEIEWQIGGHRNTFNSPRQQIMHWPCRQHTAKFLSEDLISVFDNGNGCRHYSRGVIYQLDYESMVITQIDEVIPRPNLEPGAAGSYDFQYDSHLLGYGFSDSLSGIFATETFGQNTTSLTVSDSQYMTYQIWRRFNTQPHHIPLYLPILTK